MKRLLFVFMLLVSSEAWAFSFATGGCAASGCEQGEQWLNTNANEIDTALDTVESNITTLQGRDTITEHESVDGVNVILATEIDTTAELNTILLDDDFLTANGSYSIATTGSGVFSGTLQGGVRVTVQSASTLTLTSTGMLGNLHYATNASGLDVTLPGAAAGLNACFYDGNGGGVVVLDAAAGDAINLDGVSVGTADAIDSAGNVGDFICLLAIDASTWVTLGRSGTWVDGGVD